MGFKLNHVSERGPRGVVESTDARSMADSWFRPSQCETALLCNDVSHWLGAILGSALPIFKWVAVISDSGTKDPEAHSLEILCNLSLDTSIEIYIKFHSSGQEIPCHFCGNFMAISIEILQQLLEMTRNFHWSFFGNYIKVPLQIYENYMADILLKFL